VISRITGVSLRSRGLLLLPVGAFVVHQLRYRIAYGPQASAQLHAQGHSYLDSFAPWLVLLLCLAVGSFLARVSQALATGRPTGCRRSFGAVWVVATCLLIGIYAIQEFLEGLVAAGHPSGLQGVVGHGGWWAGIVAIGVGAVIALLLRAATAVVDAAARAGPRPRSLRLDLGRTAVPVPVSVARPRPLAASRAGRAPPFRV
jgi:hypothetical protein